MNRLDRALGILLLLRSGKTLSATELAQRFEVSVRTIYRDIETLSAVGVPVYAENGRYGGYRLVEGYFLPPVTFSVGEATSLLTGLALLRRLRVKPFPVDLAAAGEKLLAALPDYLRTTLAEMDRRIGFEATPHDSFHPDPSATTEPDEAEAAVESHMITTFLQAILDHNAVLLDYQPPYDRPQTRHILAPEGLLWDRERWYLIGRRVDAVGSPRLLRADRVISMSRHGQTIELSPAFDIARFLGRRWLSEAMSRWAENAPVIIRMTSAQAEQLQRDWYYEHAHFEVETSGRVLMTCGESDRQVVFALLRWLGPGAELITPDAWRADFAAEVRAMLGPYEVD
jgi:predicted DNA-binding transcriptional regulator YafY